MQQTPRHCSSITARPPVRAWTAGSSMWYAVRKVMQPYRRCHVVTAGYLSSFAGDDPGQLRARADALLAGAGASDGLVVTDLA